MVGVWLTTGGEAIRADFVVSSDELRTIDPQRVSYLDEIQVAAALFEGLTRLNPETFQPEPALAQSWTISPTGLEVEFRLRPGLVWSDGSRLTAEDFRRSWLRVLEPATQAQYASMLFVLEGAESYYRSRLNKELSDDTDAASVGIKATEEDVLRLRLARPCPYLLDLTSYATLAPVHRGASEARRPWARPESIATCGAFRLERWDFKRRLLLRRSDTYWDRASIEIDTIEVFITGSPTAALVGYETGRIDLLRGVEPEAARKLARQKAAGARPDFHLSPRFATFFLRVNCTRPPLRDNPALRKALSLAIDREQICRNVLGLGEAPATTYVPRGSLALLTRRAADGTDITYVPPEDDEARQETIEQRHARARSLLDASGYREIARERPLQLAYASDPPQQRRVMEAVQAMWESVLGIRVELLVMERRVLSERIRNLDYDLVRSDWFGDYLDPGTFLDMFTTGNGQNRTGFSDVAYDRLISEALAESDVQQRYRLYAEAERILCYDQLPIIPLYERSGNFLLRPEFIGLRDNVRDTLPIHRVRRASAVER